MVTRKRLRSIFTALGLYVTAALLISYFGVNAYGGNRGLKAQKDIDLQVASLSADYERLKLEETQWQRRINLLKSTKLDPDMLDESARKLLDFANPADLILMLKDPPAQLAAGADVTKP